MLVFSTMVNSAFKIQFHWFCLVVSNFISRQALWRILGQYPFMSPQWLLLTWSLIVKKMVVGAFLIIWQGLQMYNVSFYGVIAFGWVCKIKNQVVTSWILKIDHHISERSSLFFKFYVIFSDDCLPFVP